MIGWLNSAFPSLPLDSESGSTDPNESVSKSTSLKTLWKNQGVNNSHLNPIGSRTPVIALYHTYLFNISVEKFQYVQITSCQLPQWFTTRFQAWKKKFYLREKLLYVFVLHSQPHSDHNTLFCLPCLLCVIFSVYVWCVFNLHSLSHGWHLTFFIFVQQNSRKVISSSATSPPPPPDPDCDPGSTLRIRTWKFFLFPRAINNLRFTK